MSKIVDRTNNGNVLREHSANKPKVVEFNFRQGVYGTLNLFAIRIKC